MTTGHRKSPLKGATFQHYSGETFLGGSLIVAICICEVQRIQNPW